MKVWVQLGIVQKCFKDKFFRHFLVPFLGMFFFQLKTCNGMKVGWFGLGLCPRSPYLSVVPYCTKALLICRENGFSHSIPSMFHDSRSRNIRSSPFWSYEDLNFGKSSETLQFQHFFDNSNEILFSDSKSLGNNFG